MSNELYHYGVLHRSGRYPYGSGERPYQGEAKGGGFFKKRKEKRAEKLKTTQKIQNENEEAKRIERKEKALSSKSPTQIYKVKDDLTDTELQNALTRIQREQQLKKLSAAEIENGKKFFKTLDKINSTAVKLLTYYDTIQKIAKIMNGDGGKDTKAAGVAKAVTDSAKESKKSNKIGGIPITKFKDAKDLDVFELTSQDVPKSEIDTMIRELGDVELFDVDIRKRK